MKPDRNSQGFDDRSNNAEPLTLHGLRTADYVKAEPLLSIEQKSALAVRLAAALNPDNGSVSDSVDAEAILRLIIWNSDPPVVESIARAAAGNPNTPHDLAWALANDDESAAVPILAASTALSDDDLVAIIEGTESFSKMGAIASRSSVAEGVSRSLAQHGDENTAQLLLSNANAKIPDDAFACMLDRHGQHERIQRSIIGRETIPSSIRQHLSNLTGVEPVPSPSETKAAAILPVSRHAASSPVGYLDDLNERELDELISQMMAERSITASFLARKLCLGNFDFFCRALSAMASSPKEDVCRDVVESPSSSVTELWGKASLASGWLPIACAAVSALIQIDKDYNKSDAQLFRRNVVDRTLAILKAEKHELSDGQKKFFRSL